MSRKMLFFDIDGTLVAEGTHYLPQSAVNAIRRQEKMGIWRLSIRDERDLILIFFRKYRF